MGGAYARGRLHVGGKYSDLTITCNYRQWAVHRAIVCSRSGFFDGACSYAFREAETRSIDLSEDDEEAVNQMIHCMSLDWRTHVPTLKPLTNSLPTVFYHLDYLNEPKSPRPTVFRHRAFSDARRKMPKRLDLSLVQDPLLAAAGCYPPQSPLTPPTSSTSDARGVFDFPLKTPQPPIHARAQTPPLVSDTESDYDSYSDEDDASSSSDADESHLLLHTKVYALAEKYDIPSLKQVARSKFERAMACHYDSPDFADAIEEVYCSTLDSDRGLRDIVLEAFKSHPQLANTGDVYRIIEGTPSLARELYKIERGIPV